MEINQIVESLHTALQALSEMEKENRPQHTVESYERIETMARLNPFSGHILSGQNEAVRDIYITALLAIFDSEKEDTVKENQMLVLGRIIASYDKEINFEQYTVRCAKIGETFWSDFADFMVGDLKLCFAVDAMLVFNMSRSRTAGTMKSIADAMSILGLDNHLLRKAAGIARAVMTQNFHALLNIVEPSDTINYTPFLCYFSTEDWTFITNSFSSAKSLKGKVIIAGVLVENINAIINLDEFSAAHLFFYHCNFKRIYGMVSSTIQSKFVNCIFQDNYTPEIGSNKNGLGIFGGKGKEPDKNFVYLDLANTCIVSSQFINCRATKNLICLTNGKISDCKFEDCHGIDSPCSYLLQINSSMVKGCSFTRCGIETDRSDRSSTTGGLVYLSRADMSRCTFKDCDVKGNTSYGRYAHFYMYIVMASESNVSACEFEKCSCQCDHVSDVNSSSYILGLSNSSEQNNDFKECQSYHYQYGNNLGTHNAGTI